MAKHSIYDGDNPIPYQAKNTPVRVMINIVLLQLGAFALSFAAMFLLSNVMEDNICIFLSSIIAIITYYCYVYTYFWRIAEYERNVALYSNKKIDTLHGLYLITIASIPGYVLVLLSIIAHLGLFDVTVINFVTRVFFGYLLFVFNIYNDISPYWYLLLPLGPILVATIGYFAGTKLFRISDKLIYKEVKRSRQKKLR